MSLDVTFHGHVNRMKAITSYFVFKRLHVNPFCGLSCRVETDGSN